MTIEQNIKTIITNYFGRQDDPVNDYTRYDADLGASESEIELLFMDIEEEFSISVDLQEDGIPTNVKETIEYIKSKI